MGDTAVGKIIKYCQKTVKPSKDIDINDLIKGKKDVANAIEGAF